MKSLLQSCLVVLVAGLGVSDAAERADNTAAVHKTICWEQDVETAYKKGLKLNKPIVVVYLCPLSESKCVHCKRFRGEIFSESFQQLSGQAVFALVEIKIRDGKKSSDEWGAQLFEKLECESAPLVTVLEPNAKVIVELFRLKGYFTAAVALGHVQSRIDKWQARRRVAAE